MLGITLRAYRIALALLLLWQRLLSTTLVRVRDQSVQRPPQPTVLYSLWPLLATELP